MDQEIRRQAIKNAYLHDGRADVSSVVSKLISENPEIKKNIKNLIPDVKKMVDEINSLGREKIDEIVANEYPEFLIKEKREEKHELPELRNVHGRVVMRMAPSPSGPLHIGHSRMAILNDEYVKRYGGELILRIEDTNPDNIDPDAYQLIPEDLKWLGVNVTKSVIQSSRMEIYYRYARDMIKSGHLYVIERDQKYFHDMKMKSLAVPERNASPEENEEKFDRLLNNYYDEGQAAVVMKTDLNHPNESIRDWIAFRINKTPHPLTGDRYVLYPTMNFSVSIDDHLLGLTHVIRGIDHLVNTEKQRYVFRANNWKEPEYYHYGFIKIPDSVLKTSTIKEGIRTGRYTGWDDVRLGTLMALRKRGYSPETFRRYWIMSGMRESNAVFSWEIFDSIDREIIDYKSMRFFFVNNPVKINLENNIDLKSHVPYHPERPDLGFREYDFQVNSDIYIDENDLNSIAEGEYIRLKDLCMARKAGGKISYVPDDGRRKLRVIHWCPVNSIDFKVYRPDGTVDSGKLEPLAESLNGVAQMERYGYINKSGCTGYYLHR